MTATKLSRISGGEFRGRSILSPNSSETHPMGARERLALFNALGARKNLRGVRVLDTYAGTGALGLEALSRGAAEVTFVEKNKKALSTLAENIDTFGVSEVVGVVAGDVVKFTTCEKFDVIFVDPPYDKYSIEEFRHLAEHLTKGGVMVISHPEGATIEIDGLKVVSDRGYAAANIAILEKV